MWKSGGLYVIIHAMARKITLKPVAKQNRNNNHKHSDKRKHPILKNGR